MKSSANRYSALIERIFLDQKHYLLVPATDISAEDLERYGRCG